MNKIAPQNSAFIFWTKRYYHPSDHYPEMYNKIHLRDVVLIALPCDKTTEKKSSVAIQLKSSPNIWKAEIGQLMEDIPKYTFGPTLN